MSGFTGSVKMTLIDMLRLLSTTKKTGAMKVQVPTSLGDKDTVVHFKGGLVIAVDTGSEELGAILLQENLITRDDLNQAITLQKQYKDKRIEQILMAMKKVDATKLVKAIRLQIESVITQLLQEKNARVEFEPDAVLRVQGLSNGVDVQQIMLLVAPKVDEMELVKEKIQSSGQVPAITKRGKEEKNEISLKLVEWQVYLAIDGKTDIKTLALKLKMEEVTVMKALVTLLDGKWVELPKAQADTRKKILAVDDSKVILKTIQLALAETGYSLFTAETGEAAIKLALEQQPDLILLDVMLPDTTGLKVCKTLRTEHATMKQTPIIMLSAKDADIDRNLGLHAGANDYVTKPFKDGELVEIVHKYLKNTN
ncbi:MAG: response regulator [Chloroherpetonaceae bacterium]|nr:response regulator [Chloroherpetonaceae bacterium]